MAAMKNLLGLLIGDRDMSNAIEVQALMAAVEVAAVAAVDRRAQSDA